MHMYPPSQSFLPPPTLLGYHRALGLSSLCHTANQLVLLGHIRRSQKLPRSRDTLSITLPFFFFAILSTYFLSTYLINSTRYYYYYYYNRWYFKQSVTPIYLYFTLSGSLQSFLWFSTSIQEHFPSVKRLSFSVSPWYTLAFHQSENSSVFPLEGKAKAVAYLLQKNKKN